MRLAIYYVKGHKEVPAAGYAQSGPRFLLRKLTDRPIMLKTVQFKNLFRHI